MSDRASGLLTTSLVAALWTLTIPPAAAHDTTTSWTIVRVRAQEVELTVKIAAESVWPFVQTVAPGVLLEMERLDALRPTLADSAKRMHELSVNGRALVARTGEGRVVEDYLEFHVVFPRPEAGSLALKAGYLAVMSPEFTADVTVLDASDRLLASRTLTGSAPLLEVTLPEGRDRALPH